MPDLSSFTLGTSSIALGDFIVGYEAAAGSGSERRWTADDLTTGLLALAGATPAEVALLSGVTSNIQAQIDAASGGLTTHAARTDNPHTVTATQVGLGNVDNTSDADKPVSTLQASAIGVVQADIDAHELLTNNPHTVTATQVGLGNVDNTSDADKPVSTLQAAAIATAGGAFEAGADTAITPTDLITLSQAAGDEAALTLDYTTNKAAGNDTGLLINQTDTLSPGTSRLLDLQVGGVSQLSVANSGQVGIGTDSPNTDISVLRDDANVAGLRVDQLGTGPARVSLHVTDGGGDAYIGFGVEDAQGVSLNRSWHMGVDNSDAEAFNISTGGSVGNTPSFRMDRDTGAATLNLDQEGGFQVRRNSASLNDAATLGFRFTTSHGDDHAQIKGIRTDAPGSAATALAFSTRDASALVERLRIDGEGNVGIGTTTPGSALQVVGDIDTDGAYQKGGATILDADSGLASTAVGEGALSDALMTGVNNTATGYQSLIGNESGTSNTATGHTSLFSNTIGAGNVATGRSALFSNIGGDFNVASGFQSLYSNQSGSHNAAAGYQSLFSNVDGDYNVAAGSQSLYANTSGTTNLALSREALRFNTVGNYNIAAGYRALYQNVGGSHNVAVGRQCLGENVSGDSNSAVGYAAMLNCVSGLRNSSLGYVSLYGLTSGSNNVAIGSAAARFQNDGGTPLATADDSTFIGSYTEGVDAATNQTVIGYGAEGLGSNTTVLGSSATTLTRLQGDVDTDGAYQKDGVTILDADTVLDNLLLGGAGNATITGTDSVLTGAGAGAILAGGTGNTATGFESLNKAISSANNAAFGKRALKNNTAHSNAAFGYESLQGNTTGTENAGCGRWSGFANQTGSYNTSVGGSSLLFQNGGDGNVGIGHLAGTYQNVTGNLTSANDSIFIGASTTGINSATNQIVIGYGAEGLGSNTTVLGSSATTQTQIFGGIVLPDLPTADPVNAGELWSDSGTLKVSAG